MKTRLHLLILGAILAGAGCASDANRIRTPEEVMASPEAKLRSIILTDIQLTNVSLDEALRYLTEQSRTADPDRVGVTIAYRQFDLQEVLHRITLRLPQATVMQALNEVCRQAHCAYLIEKDRVSVLSEGSLKSLHPARRSVILPRY